MEKLSRFEQAIADGEVCVRDVDVPMDVVGMPPHFYPTGERVADPLMWAILDVLSLIEHHPHFGTTPQRFRLWYVRSGLDGLKTKVWALKGDYEFPDSPVRTAMDSYQLMYDGSMEGIDQWTVTCCSDSMRPCGQSSGCGVA